MHTRRAVVAVGLAVVLGACTASRVGGPAHEPGTFGFAYGTLPRHPEAGEESFVVRRSPVGSVTFEVVALSRPTHLLAKAVPPVADRLQAQATRRYLDAMRSAVI